jgi:hypothetical protein
VTPRNLATQAVLSLLVGGSMLAAQEGPADVRREIDRLAYQIDESMRQVCRPSPLNLFGPTQLVRGYRIPGMGVVFVVPPRSLPSARLARARDTQTGRAAQTAAAAPALERRTRPVPPPPPPGGRRAIGGARASHADQAELALRAFEEQVRTMDEAAARMHQGVQQAMAEMMREVQQSNAGASRPQTTADAADEGFPPLLLLPPWSQSWGVEFPADTRSAREVLDAVRDAVSRALASGAFVGLASDESLVVTVEFYADDTLDLAARPTTTLVTRLHARDVEAHQRGTLPAEELLRRVETSEF